MSTTIPTTPADCSMSYPTASGSLQVLDDVTFRLPAGDSALTILGALGQRPVHPPRPVCWPRSAVFGLRASRRRRPCRTQRGRAGPATQRPTSGSCFRSFQLLPTLTARENVMVPLELRGSRTPRVRALELLDQVGLAQRADPTRSSCRVASSSGWPSPGPWWASRRSCSPTSPPATSMGPPPIVIRELLFDIPSAAGASLVLVTHDEGLAQRADSSCASPTGSRGRAGVGVMSAGGGPLHTHGGMLGRATGDGCCCTWVRLSLRGRRTRGHPLVRRQPHRQRDAQAKSFLGADLGLYRRQPIDEVRFWK